MSDTLEITGLAHGGFGVGRIEGQVCFVAYGLPGDLVRLKSTRRRKGLLWAEIAEVIEPSPHRVAAACPHFGACGGCMWLHFDYPAQGEWKCRLVRDSFERIARIDIEPAWREAPDLRLGYRTRAEFHCDGKAWGFRARGTHRVAPIDRCPLCHGHLNAAYQKLREVTTPGSVELVVDPEGGASMLWISRPSSAQRRLFPEANSPRDARERCSFVFDGIPVVNGCFSQSSLLLNRLLQEVVHETIGEGASLLDLFCGNGNLSIGLADTRRVVGIDHNLKAVQAADSMGEGSYRSAKETAFKDVLMSEDWDTVLLDPPRTGAKALMQNLIKCRASALVYVSCDPATLARDARMLAEGGWRLTKVTAVDIFPNTSHIESICRFER